jgi:mannose-6-phosphate isomerase-like protein (cupin superfamily)
MPGGVRTEIHLAGEDTAGAFCLLIDRSPAGWSLPPHRHLNEAETIHIVEGAFEIDLDGTPTQLVAGESIHIPHGITHSTSNIGRQVGRRIVIFSPAGMEHFFLEAGQPTASSEPDLAAVLASAARHGWQFAPPS